METLSAPAMLALSVLYFLPSLIAIHRDHPRALQIFLVNLLLGATIAGWVYVIFQSCTKSASQSSKPVHMPSLPV